jgi:hypothetical protein
MLYSMGSRATEEAPLQDVHAQAGQRLALSTQDKALGS